MCLRIRRIQPFLCHPKLRPHLRCQNLCLARPHKVQLTHSQLPLISRLIPDRRPKRPAKNRPARIQIAPPRRRIKYRANIRMRKLLKQLNLLFAPGQHPRRQIPRIPRPQPLPSRRHPQLYRESPPRVHPFQLRQPIPQPSPIDRRNLKHPVAALRTPRPASQPPPTPPDRILQRRIDNLNQILSQFVLHPCTRSSASAMLGPDLNHLL